MTKAKQIDERLFRQLWRERVPCKAIAEHFGMKSTWATKTAQRLGLPRRQYGSAYLPAAKIRWLYQEHGWSARRIAKQFNASKATITRMLQAYQIKTKPPGPEPVDKVQECATLADAGYTYGEIGKRFGLSRGQVGYRVRRFKSDNK